MAQITPERTYLAIDLKSFYASVECVKRGLDPLTARLVVADESRTEKTICLAVTPALKALGISGRARLFEVYEKAPRGSFIIAKPAMADYLQISSEIFAIYAAYVATEDIHVYSIDEAFLDITSYLRAYEMDAEQLARTIIKDVLGHTGITATAGLGSNLYLAKIAMDILAKHQTADLDGVRIASLDETSYRKLLWTHQPLTDFWRIGPGISRSLHNFGIYTMGDLAHFSLTASEKLYRKFGVNAELIIDHAWGIEPTTIADIKSYRRKDHSLSSGQVLATGLYSEKLRNILVEMADKLCHELHEKHLLTNNLTLHLSYDKKAESTPVKPFAHGSKSFSYTDESNLIIEYFLQIFTQILDPTRPVKKLGLTLGHLKSADLITTQLDLFENQKTAERAKRNQKLEQATLLIKQKYGKNAILRGTSYLEGSTMRERNQQIGGHRA